MDHHLTDEYWRAIVFNDPKYDGQFFYGVETTHIFCRPMCKSPVPKKESVKIFYSAIQAVRNRFRPCKRCRPMQEQSPDDEQIAQAVKYINENYNKALNLKNLSLVCHSSPYHLHRIFKKVKGVTIGAYIQQYRIEKARFFLNQPDMSIAKIATRVGFSNSAYFATVFKKRIGMTPKKYRMHWGVKNG